MHQREVGTACADRGAEHVTHRGAAESVFPKEGDSELELVAPCPPFPSTSSEAAGGLSIVSWLCSATTIEVGGQGAWAVAGFCQEHV